MSFSFQTSLSTFAKLTHDDPRAVSAMASPRGKWSSRRRGSHACACNPPTSPGFPQDSPDSSAGAPKMQGPGYGIRSGPRKSRRKERQRSSSFTCHSRVRVCAVAFPPCAILPRVAPFVWSAGLIWGRAQQTHREPVLGGLYVLASYEPCPASRIDP